MAVPEDAMHVAYFLSRFPNLTTTFTFNEMLSLQRMGVRVTAVSVRRGIDDVLRMDNPAVAFQRHCLYAPLHSVFVWWCFLAAWFHQPDVMSKAAWHILTSASPNPYAIVKCCVALLKAPYLAHRIREQGITHLHANFASLPATTAMFTSWLAGVPFSFKCHAFDIYARSWRLVNCLEALKLRDASFVAAAHSHARNHLIAKFGEAFAPKLFVVNTGVDVAQFRPNKFREAGETRFLCVAQQFEKKGTCYLVEACARLRNLGLSFSCTIVGDGPLLESLRQMSATYGLDAIVTFEGSVLHYRVRQYLANADVFVLPCVVAKDGDRDGIPTVLIEAMSSGVPTISTPVAGIPELIDSGRTGLLVCPRNAAELATAMLRLATDQKLARQLAYQGREHVKQHFNTAINSRRMAELFRTHGRGLSVDSDISQTPTSHMYTIG